MLSICTSRFNIKNSTLCSQSEFLCYVRISERTATISLYNTNCFVFTAEMQCVYCAVRNESLNIFQATFIPQSFNLFNNNFTHVTTFTASNKMIAVNNERTHKEDAVVCFTVLSQDSSTETETKKQLNYDSYFSMHNRTPTFHITNIKNKTYLKVITRSKSRNVMRIRNVSELAKNIESNFTTTK